MTILFKRGLGWAILGMLILSLITSCGGNSGQPNNNSGANPERSEPEENTSQEEPFWGIDTASIVNESFYACVEENFGEPHYVGRYLGTKEGVSHGVTQEEVDLLHQRNIKIVPIYNHFEDATTYDEGVVQANQAIDYAEQAGVPEGVPLFADIEPSYPVDTAFLRGWAETVVASSYEPGIYGVFVQASDSHLWEAYQTFQQDHPDLAEATLIWTSDVEVGITTKAESPTFDPEAEGPFEVSVWQYGIDAEACNIDTNLMRPDVLKRMW